MQIPSGPEALTTSWLTEALDKTNTIDEEKVWSYTDIEADLIDELFPWNCLTLGEPTT